MLEKNESYKIMVKITNILSGNEKSFEGLPEDLKVNDFVYFKYAPITSVLCRCGTHKNMLTENR